MNLNDDIYIYILSFLKPNNICKECIENKEDLRTYINYCTVFNFKIKINICDYHIIKKKYDNLLNKIKSNIDNYKEERFSFHVSESHKNYLPRLISDFSDNIALSHFCCSDKGFMFHIKD